MWALQEFSTRNCELVSPLRGISCASGKLDFPRASGARFWSQLPRIESLTKTMKKVKKYTWDLSYSEGRGEATLKRRAFWSVTMTFPSKVQPAGGCFELQTLYGACRVFVLKSSKSQDILVKIGCFTQNGDLSNTHTQGRRHRGGNCPLKVSKEKKLKYGVFSCIKISFSVIFNKEIHALRGLLSRF